MSLFDDFFPSKKSRQTVTFFGVKPHPGISSFFLFVGIYGITGIG